MTAMLETRHSAATIGRASPGAAPAQESRYVSDAVHRAMADAAMAARVDAATGVGPDQAGGVARQLRVHAEVGDASGVCGIRRVSGACVQ